MRKHRTPEQEMIIVQFLQKHPELVTLRSGSRDLATAAWEKLTTELNAAGPPSKTAKEWRGVFKDWKIYIKQKVQRYKAAQQAIGGDRLKHLSPNKQDANKIAKNEYEDDSCEAPAKKRKLTEESFDTTNYETESKQWERNVLDSSVRDETAALEELAKKLDELNENTKAKTEAILEVGTQIVELMQQNLEESKRHNALLLKILHKKT